MDTKKVNSNQAGSKKQSNGNGGMKAAVAGVAGIAVGGVSGAMGNDVVTPEVEPQPVKPTEPVNPAPASEPEPVEPAPVAVDEPVNEPVVEPTPIVESDIHNEEIICGLPLIEDGEMDGLPNEIDPALLPFPEEDVNEIADAIISGSEIDPNDIDMEEVINFDEIGTVYTVSGEVYTAASFHGEDGNELLMVDVDGDEIFDVITTTEGELLAELNGELNLSDAEVMICGEPEYLAQNELEQQSSTVIEDIVDDIIQS